MLSIAFLQGRGSVVQQIVIVLIVLGAFVLIVREFKKLAAGGAVPVETGPVAAQAGVVSAGDSGPGYLSYNTPGTYYIGPPVDNYSGNAPVAAAATGNQCAPCAAFQGIFATLGVAP
jgi:hypothetical protein